MSQPLTWEDLYSEMAAQDAASSRDEPYFPVMESMGLAGAIEPALNRIFPEPNPYINDPVLWVTDKLGGHVWSKQIDILNAIRDKRYVAVQSAHGTGKSYTASCAGAWFLDVHDLGSAFLITTAPSWAQVEKILWREIRRRHREGKLGGRITLDCEWHLGEPGAKRGDSSEEIIAFGRKPADYDEHTFQGIHSRYFMAILDEACGIPEWLWDAVLSLATNENSRILAIGNPDDPNSRFAKVCQQWKHKEDAAVIRISAFDSPNFTDEFVPVHVAESLVSKVWVDDRRDDWGEGSPIWTAKVEGIFPDISDEYLISPALLRKAYETNVPGLEKGRYGMDVARMGADKTVIYRNRGGQIRFTREWAKMDTEETADAAMVILGGHGTRPVPCTVDMIGVGAGVYDKLKRKKVEVAGYQGSERAFNNKQFVNRRTEIYWEFRQAMEDGLIDLDEDDTILAAQLGSIKWGLQPGTMRIQIETKEDLRDRGLPSPDRADAAVLSTVEVGSYKEAMEMMERERRRKKETSVTGDLLQKVM